MYPMTITRIVCYHVTYKVESKRQSKMGGLVFNVIVKSLELHITRMSPLMYSTFVVLPNVTRPLLESDPY